jgi:hypothetical protein
VLTQQAQTPVGLSSSAFGTLSHLQIGAFAKVIFIITSSSGAPWWWELITAYQQDSMASG